MAALASPKHLRERAATIQAKIRGAMVYPAMIVAVALVVISVVILFVILYKSYIVRLEKKKCSNANMDP